MLAFFNATFCRKIFNSIDLLIRFNNQMDAINKKTIHSENGIYDIKWSMIGKI